MNNLEAWDEIAATDGLLPSQYFAAVGAVHSTPEKRLLAELLQDAILCFQKHASAVAGPLRVRWEEAAHWLFGDYDSELKWTFSFESACGYLKIEPSCLREGLRYWYRLRMTGQPVRLIPRHSPHGHRSYEKLAVPKSPRRGH